jgi:hypothetical protein
VTAEPALPGDVNDNRQIAKLNLVGRKLVHALLADDGRMPLVAQPALWRNHRRKENEVTERGEKAAEFFEHIVGAPVGDSLQRQTEQVSALGRGRVQEGTIFPEPLVGETSASFGRGESQRNRLLRGE